MKSIKIRAHVYNSVPSMIAIECAVYGLVRLSLTCTHGMLIGTNCEASRLWASCKYKLVNAIRVCSTIHEVRVRAET